MPYFRTFKDWMDYCDSKGHTIVLYDEYIFAHEMFTLVVKGVFNRRTELGHLDID